MMRKPPAAWVAESRELYVSLGVLYSQRRELQAKLADVTRQIAEAHAAVDHLRETSDLAADAVEAATPKDADKKPGLAVVNGKPEEEQHADHPAG